MSNVSQVATSQPAAASQQTQQAQQQANQQQNQASQQQQQQQANQQQNQTQQLTTIPGTNIQIPTSVATANGIISGNNIKLEGSGILKTLQSLCFIPLPCNV